jgi:endonuclease VIII
MPEGDTIFRAARTLSQALSGETVKHFETVLPKLARVDFDSPLAGRVIEKVEAQGKWMLIYFSADLILLTHMLMSGSWHIYRQGEPWKKRNIHKRIVIETAKYVAVAFNVPIAEFHTAASLQRHERLRRLGPSVLAPKLDVDSILRNLRIQTDAEVGVALLNQSVLAGIGNVFKSEICFTCGVNPFRKVETLTVSELGALVASARQLMLANVAASSTDRTVTYNGLRRTTGRSDPDHRLWVYRRRGKRCHRCGASILAQKQGQDARTTYWCPNCQPMFELSKVQATAMGS